jgi:recombination protein RecT
MPLRIKMSNGTIAVKDKVSTLRQMLESRMDTIARTLPSQLMQPARFAQIVTTLCAQNPMLLDCKPASLIGSVLQCAALGLSPDPALGNAWFIPFKGVVQFIPGYKGLATLAWRSGQVASLAMNVVHEGDVFDYELGSSPFLKHKPIAMMSAPLTFAYATAKPIGGEIMFEVLSLEQIKAIQARSPSARSGRSPWTTDFEAMAKKSAFRRLAKLLPISAERAAPLGKALDLDERAELGLQQHNEELLGENFEEEQETETEAHDATGTSRDGRSDASKG